jgi:hypothetical protein
MNKNLGSILEALVLGGALTVGAGACGGGHESATEDGDGEATQGGEMSCSGNSCSGAMHGGDGQTATNGDAQGSTDAQGSGGTDAHQK